MNTLFIALRSFLFLSFLTGIVYPLLVTGGAVSLFPYQAKGSLIGSPEGKISGSELIGQSFKTEGYFWGRPSAIDYNPLPSGGTNLGPTAKALQEKWAERRKQGFEGKMLAASASGLDPHTSVETALAQVSRVAKARGIEESAVNALIETLTEQPDLGFLGKKRINIVKLNSALDKIP